MAINTTLSREEQWIQMGTDNAKVFAKKLGEETRFLGVWLNATMENKKSIARIHKSLEDFIPTTRCKKATLAQLVYIYNNVIIPKIEYLHKITHLSESQCHTLERKAIAYLKNRASLLRTASDNILFHKGIVGIKRLWDNYIEAHITSLIQRLNSIGPESIITEISLKKA